MGACAWLGLPVRRAVCWLPPLPAGVVCLGSYMSISDLFLGLVSAPAYALQRSKIGLVRLHVLAMLLGPVVAVCVALEVWLDEFVPQHVALAALCLLGTALLLWVHLHHYLVFRATPSAVSETAPDLRTEQRLLLRGSGIFEVSKMRSYLVEVPVVFWTTRLAEHIVSARVRAFNLLGVGVPSDERGWWYAFIDPRRVRRIEPGELCFGLHRRPAVRVDFTTEKGLGTLHLSCDNQAQLQVLLKELKVRAAAKHE